MKISYYSNGITQTRPDKALDLSEVLAVIKRPGLRARIEALRAERDSDQQEALKRQLPYVTWSGVFNKRAKDDATFLHSGLLCLDFDNVSDLKAARAKVEKDPFVMVAFTSPGGAGLKVVLKIAADGDQHEQAFRAAVHYFKTKYNLTADESGKDVSRACFLSHDPALYCNTMAPVFDAQAVDAAPVVRDERKPAPAADAGAEKIAKGQRNVLLTSLAGRLRRDGLRPGEIEAALRVRNEVACDPPLAETEVQRIAESVSRYPAGAPDEPLAVDLASIEPQAVSWLWRNYFPLGSASLLSGDPGCGKTWLILDAAARVSRGSRWLDGSEVGAPGNVVYLSVEDDAASTIRPRLDGLGGDPSKVFVYNVKQQRHLDLSQPEGIDRLEAEVERIGNVQLVVIDPIADFSGAVNPNAAEEVRALLTPLLQLAAKHDFALVLIGHLNKAQSLGAIYRAGGSTSGWLGKVRAAFMVFRDVDDRGLRHVVALKANLAQQDPEQLEFRLEAGQLLGRVSKAPVDVEAQLAPKRGPMPRTRDDAMEWLASLFDERSEVPSTEIEKAAAAKGFSWSTLKRAKREGGYRAKKQGDGSWVWIKQVEEGADAAPF